MKKCFSGRGVSQLYMTFFLHSLAVFMVVPAITDVTMSAICPGREECSLAIYLTGFQQVMTGVGTLVMMPLIGNLSDKYGRKPLLTLPITLPVIPLAILAYSRERSFFYAYYVLRTLTAMLCEGSIHCLAFAYLADNVADERRASAFGVFSGIGSCAFVCATLSARFLSTTYIFQVATAIAIAAAVYLRLFLPDSTIEIDHTLGAPILQRETSKLDAQADDTVLENIQIFRPMLSWLKTSLVFSQAAIVSFFSNLADVGLHASLLYYLKAKFHFNKDQFADLMVISGIAGSISQLVLMPFLAPALGEERLLSIGLFFACAHMFLYSIAWSIWVPYVAAMFSIFFVFTQPCLRSIVSKQVGSCEQGKAQGVMSGIGSFANVISPLAFSPLTALFLSDTAPFHFPGLSIMCAALASMIAFFQSIMIRAATPIDQIASSENSMEA